MTATMPPDDTNGGSGSRTIFGLPAWVVGVAAACLVAVLLLGWFFTSNSVTNNGNKREQDLNKQYVSNQEILSTCLVNSRQAVQVASAQTAAIDTVLTDVIVARQPQEQGATEGKLFSAIQEAYPNTNVDAIYRDVMTIVTGCREKYSGVQQQMLQKLALFDKWRKGSAIVRTFGGGNYPSDDLVARIGKLKPCDHGTSPTESKPCAPIGKDAYDAMYAIVQVQGSVDAYTTGTIPDPDLFTTTTVG